MNEFLRKFIMDTLKEMIGNVAEWQVREYALGWYSKGVLTQEDLEEIQRLIEESKKVEPEETAENTAEFTENVEPVEEPVVENEQSDTEVDRTEDEVTEETEAE